MSSVTVFFLVCLGLFAVTSRQSFARRHNANVPSSAQQCIDKGYFGACFLNDLAELVVYRCEQLACAEKVPGREKYIKRLTGPPVNGTHCGISKICVNKRCKLVNKNEVPKYFGSIKQRRCRVA